MERISESPHIVCQRLMESIETMKDFKIFVKDKTEVNEMHKKVTERIEIIKKGFLLACKNAKKKRAQKERTKKVLKQKNKEQKNNIGFLTTYNPIE